MQYNKTRGNTVLNTTKQFLQMAETISEELGSGNHIKGRFCSICGKKVNTKKIGSIYVCSTCDEKSGKEKKKPIYENKFMCWCKNIELVEKASTCKICGKMLCGLCGEYCNDHIGCKV